MKNGRLIAFLLVIIAALATANVMLRKHDRVRRSVARVALLEPQEGVTRVTVAREGQVAADLVKTDGWRIVAPYSGLADESSVAKLLDALSLTPIADTIDDAELLKIGRARADFALAEPALTVAVSGKARCVTVQFGSVTPSGDGNYAAVEGVNAIFVVPTNVLVAADRTADDFRHRSILLMPPESVASFEIKCGASPALPFTREGDGWKAGEAAASEPKVRKFLSDVAGASALDFVWPVGASNEAGRASASLLAGYGLEPESATTVTLRGTDGAERRISFGKNAGEKKVYALVQDGGAIVTVPEEIREMAAQGQMKFTDSRIFPTEAKSVSFVSLADGEMACALARDGAGTWRLETPIVAVADAAAVAGLVERILALSPSDVTEKGLSVAIATNAAPTTVVRERALGGMRLEDLRSAEVIRIDPAGVKRLVRTVGGQPTSVVRDRERKAWNVDAAAEGATADEKGIESVLAAINPLVAARVEKLKVAAADLDDYGLDKPYLTVAIDQDREDAVRRNVMVGAKAAGGGRYATVGSADAVFVLSDAVVKRLGATLVKQ